MPLLRWDGQRLHKVGFADFVTASASGSYTAATEVTPPPVTPSAVNDWSDSNLPWAYSSTSAFTARWPSAVNIDPLQTASSDFYTNLKNTVSAANSRVVVQIPDGIQHLNQFRLIGASGDPTYSFGFWFPNLQGFLGNGPDRSFIQMDANSMSQAQLDKLAGMTQASFAPNQMGLCRLDGSSGSPILLGGLTFQAADQNPLTAKASDVSIVVPQPAPHQGVVIYNGSTYRADFVRFQGAGRAAYSQPPFEHANVSVARSSGTFANCEFDGRRAASIDSARPRRTSTIMLNNESFSELVDCWGHHSNVSRYAANDQNVRTAGQATNYRVTRCKWEQITNTKNDGLGGYTNATPFGWESSNAFIQLTDTIIKQDNSYTDPQIAQHLQVTVVGGVSQQGGRLQVIGGQFRNSGFPSVDGYLCIRATSSYWVSDGYDTTMDVRATAGGARKAAYVVTGSWPPTAASLSAAGVSPDTHYLVRNS